MTNPRLISAQIIQKILEEKVFFGELKKQIGEKDLPFCNMLILTVLRRLTALKQILNGFISRKIPHKHRLAEYLLWCAIAEILFMKTAEYAVLNETIKNIRKVSDKFLSAMANAVLRRVCMQKENLLLQAQKIMPLPDSYLEILEGYTAEQIKQIANSIFMEPPLDLTVKDNPSEWKSKLDADLLPNGSLRLYNNPKISQIPAYTDGMWWVQDVAAALPVQTLGDISAKTAIDLCAAPGGKTAQLCAKGAAVTALDISAARLEILKQNMLRLGFNNIKTQATDALEYLQNADALYDIVLLDAPCSATGTFRRHPEVLHIKSKNDVTEQAVLQKKLLNACRNILKVGGILVYSVCSISKTEGEQQIENFLKENPDFKIMPITQQDVGFWKDNLILPNGTVRTLPYYAKSQGGMDSFFICKMQRII